MLAQGTGRWPACRSRRAADPACGHRPAGARLGLGDAWAGHMGHADDRADAWWEVGRVAQQHRLQCSQSAAMQLRRPWATFLPPVAHRALHAQLAPTAPHSLVSQNCALVSPRWAECHLRPSDAASMPMRSSELRPTRSQRFGSSSHRCKQSARTPPAHENCARACREDVAAAVAAWRSFAPHSAAARAARGNGARTAHLGAWRQRTRELRCVGQ